MNSYTNNCMFTKNDFQNSYLYYQERLFSSLKNYARAKNVTLKTSRLYNFTQIFTL